MKRWDTTLCLWFHNLIYEWNKESNSADVEIHEIVHILNFLCHDNPKIYSEFIQSIHSCFIFLAISFTVERKFIMNRPTRLKDIIVFVSCTIIGSMDKFWHQKHRAVTNNNDTYLKSIVHTLNPQEISSELICIFSLFFLLVTQIKELKLIEI